MADKTYIGEFVRGTSNQIPPKMVVDDNGNVVSVEPRVGLLRTLSDEDFAKLTFDQATALTPYFQWTLEPA